MPLPVTHIDLVRYGYVKLEDSHCHGCGAAIEWWLTRNKKKMPFSVRQDGALEILVPHWSDCPNAERFRRPKC